MRKKIENLSRICMIAAVLAMGTPAYADALTDVWVSENGQRYRETETGERYQNEWFYVPSTITLPSQKESVTWYYAGADGAILKNGWYNIGGAEYYFYSGGNSPRKTFFNIGEKRYYVDENGARPQPGWYAITNTNAAGVTTQSWYYIQEDGSLLKGGWKTLNNTIYYFDNNGLCYMNRWMTLDSDLYYLDQTGELQDNGWFKITNVNATTGVVSESWYYAEPNGVIARNGWREIEGEWYYFAINGRNYRKQWYVDTSGARYYLDESGKLQDNGWFKITNVNATTGVVSESWYYADQNGAVYKNGYYTIGEEQYYFDANGYNYRKRWMTEDNGRQRYLNEDGILCRGEWFSISGVNGDGSEYTNWYYAGLNTYIYKDGWYLIDGEYYYFNGSGVLQTGWVSESEEDEDGNSTTSGYFYCGEDGARRTGWQLLDIPSSMWDTETTGNYMYQNGEQAYFYFSENSGKKKMASSGVKEMEVDGRTYCFDTNGVMQQGWVKVSTTNPEISGYRYYYTAGSETSKTFYAGEKLKGTWLYSVTPGDFGDSAMKEWFYFDNSGKPVSAAQNEYLAKAIDGKYYVFDMYGKAVYGLVEVDGEIYYCGEADGDRSCAIGKTYIKDGENTSGTAYYFNQRGQGVTGEKNGYLYYKGKCQKADTSLKYELFDVPGLGKRLVNAQGKIMKNTTVKDGNGVEWKLGSNGTVLSGNLSDVSGLDVPEVTTAY